MKLTVGLLSILLFATSAFAICPGKEKRSCPGHDKLVECPHDGK
ncbi:hypothetical protein [Leptospira levettii]|nr:hypothetical protein [Leptospira levettii]